MMTHGPVFMVIIPIICALLLTMLSGFISRDITKDIITFVALLIPLLLMLLLYPRILNEPIVYEIGGWSQPYGIVLVLDGLSAIMALIVGMVTVLAFVYSLEAKRLLPDGNRYNFLFLFMTAGLYGLFLSGDIVNRYVFFELTIISTYVLLTYKGTKESLRASFNFLVIGSIASFFFLAAIALLYFETGLLDFQALSIVVPSLPSTTKNIIFSFLLIAVSMKIGLIPFHTWLPDAHVSAPTPMTAVLAGLTVKTGLYILIKTFSLGFDTPLIRGVILFLALLTALAGVMMTLRYYDLKKILAWLTISQMGIITASIALWTPLGIAGGIMHMINHSLFKCLLLLVCGALAYIHGTRDIRKLSLTNSNVLVTIGLILGVLSVMGIPPLNGFYSGTLILKAAADYPYVYGIIILTHVLTVISLVRVFHLSSKKANRTYVPESIMAPLTALGGICIFMGAASSLWMKSVIIPATSVLIPSAIFAAPGYMEISYIYDIHGLAFLGTTVVGVILGILLAPKLAGLKLNRSKGLVSQVPVTDAVRYMIIVLAVLLVIMSII